MARFNKALAQLMQQEGSDSPPQHEGTGQSRGVVAELRRRASAEEYDLAAPFFDAFLLNARLLEPKLSAGDTAELTLGAFRFLCERHTSPFALRVYSPSISEHGWSSSDLAIDIASDDQASLIESVCDAIDGRGAGIEVIISAVLEVERDDTGLVRKLRAGQAEPGECLIHLQVSGCGDPRDLEAVLRSHLDLIVRGRREAHALRKQVLALSRRLRAGSADGNDGDAEAADLIDWLNAGHMSFIGYQEQGPAAAPGTRSMGLYLNPPPGFSDVWTAPGDGPSVSIAKTLTADPLRPREFLDEVRIQPAPRPENSPIAYRIAGTLAARADTEACSAIPVARKLLPEILIEIDSDTSIDPDAARGIFDSFPLDLVLGAATTDLASLVRSIEQAAREPSFRTHICPNSSPEFCHFTLSVPRQHLSRSDGDRVVELVGRRVAPVLAKHLVSDDLSVARLHCILDSEAKQIDAAMIDEVTDQIRQMLSSWRATPMVDRSQPVTKSATTTAAKSVSPAVRPKPRQPVPSQGRPVGGTDSDSIQIVADPASSLHIITAGIRREPGALNRLVSMIDNFGIAIVEHDLHRAEAAREIHRFRVDIGNIVDLERLGELLRAVEAGNAESDGLNSLCRSTGLHIRSIAVLRCLTALAEHRGVANRTALQPILSAHTQCAAALARLFEVKFDPRLPVTSDGQRKRDREEALRRYEAAVRLVEPVDHQEALLGLAHLVEIATRTSVYCNDADVTTPSMALKLENPDSAAAPLETFVYAPEYEGFLLRRGKAARAYLQIVEDLTTLRTQLLTTLGDQRLRAGYLATEAGSAAIAIKSRRVRPELVERSLQEFLGAVLDITDSVQGDSIRGDADIESYDARDPYLSLLIDARASALAEVAARTASQREFWMRDAFVTRHDARVAAEGAWSSIQPLLPAATASQPIRVVAIGKPHQLDLPPALRLIAAFDDTEVFLDPNADAKRSSDALQKLAKRDASSWSDFPAELRGDGAGVFPLDAAGVELSEDVAEMLGGGQEVSTGEQLTRAVLRMQSDLLWSRQPVLLVTATGERAERLGSRVTIAIGDIGAAAIAEPGGPICTPAARVEFALAGGIVHTSASDELAADLIADRVSNVDLALSSTEASDAAADVGTAALATEIRRTVLELPAQHTFAIGIDRIRSRESWNDFGVCIRRLGDLAGGDPTHHLATEIDLARRQGTQRGLTSPEIVALRAAVAERIKSLVIDSSLTEDPYLGAWVDSYFPSEIPARFPGVVDRHPLRHEIAALAVSNRILDIMGAAFTANLAEARSCDEIDVVKAWCAVFIFGGAQEVAAEIEAAKDSLSTQQHQDHRLELGRALHHATSRIIDLRTHEFSLDKLIDRFGNASGELLRGWPELLPDPLRASHQAAVDARSGQGLPPPVADHLARITNLADIVDICDLAIRTNAPRSTVARVFLGLDPILDLREVGDMVERTIAQDPLWGTQSAVRLSDRVTELRRALTSDIIANAGGRKKLLENYVASHRTDLGQLRTLRGEVLSSGISIAGVEVLISRLEQMVHAHRRSW